MQRGIDYKGSGDLQLGERQHNFRGFPRDQPGGTSSFAGSVLTACFGQLEEMRYAGEFGSPDQRYETSYRHQNRSSDEHWKVSCSGLSRQRRCGALCGSRCVEALGH